MSELDLPGVTQASVAKKYGVSTSHVSRLSKRRRILLEISRAGGNHSIQETGMQAAMPVFNSIEQWFMLKLQHTSGKEL